MNAIAARMVHQGLWRPGATDVRDVVGGLVGMQAQEFQYALWSVAQRMSPDHPVTRAELLRAFDDGVLLRTHVLRPTWHFALPDDIRWLLRLTVPRLRRLMAYQDRQLELDAAELDRSRAVLSAAVDGGRHRTRKELVAGLESAGIATDGLRIGMLLMHAEYDKVLISGAMRGKQQTYAAFDERVPPGPEYSEDEALAELARRYVATRAPVTAKDLATWASLTLVQARAGLAALGADHAIGELDGLTVHLGSGRQLVPTGRLATEPANGEQTKRCPENGRPTNGRQNSGNPTSDDEAPRVDLVQGYDEVIMSYSESRGLLTGGAASLPVPDRSLYLHAILVNGRHAGHWRHQFNRGSAVIDIQLLRPLSDREGAALDGAIRRYADYLGVPTTMGQTGPVANAAP